MSKQSPVQQLSQADIFELEKKYADIEAKVCDSQNSHTRIATAIQLKDAELKELEKKLWCFVSYDAFDKFFAEKKREMESMDKMIAEKKKEADAFVSSLEKEKIDHKKCLDEMSKKIENEKKAFDVYVASKNKDLQERLKEIENKEKYIDVEIGLLSSEKDEIERQKQVSSVMYSESQKIKELAESESKKCIELQNKLSIDMENVWKLQKDLSTQIQEHTDKNNLLTKTLSDNLFLKEKNEKKMNELDIAMQDTIKKWKQYDELLKVVEERNAIVSDQEGILKDKKEKQDQIEKQISDKERAIKARERELTFQEADYKEKYNQFLLTLKLKWLKLAELQ